MAVITVPFWKEAPFIRLLIPLIGGILIQWYVELPLVLYWVILIGCLLFRIDGPDIESLYSPETTSQGHR